MRRARLRMAVNLTAAASRPRKRNAEETENTQTEVEKEKEEEKSNEIQGIRRTSEKENEEKDGGKAEVPNDDNAGDSEDKSSEEVKPSSPVKPSSATIRLKSRFKPNLVGESMVRNRLRKISGSSDVGPLGSPLGRVRTTSTSSVTSESGDVGGLKSPPMMAQLGSPTPFVEEPERRSPRPPVVERLVTLPPRTPTRSSLGEEDRGIVRHRRLTDTSMSNEPRKEDPTVFDKRKADHKKKFTQGIPERTKITMFDLIYCNPSTGNRMSTDSSNPPSARSSRANSIDSRRASIRTIEDDSEQADDPSKEVPATPKKEEELEEEEDAMPVPQVKVGPDGSIIIDEESTIIETVAAKKAKIDLLNSPLVFESSNKATNYGSWGKKRKNVDWTSRETVRFFKALSIFGTDFSMMENVFKRRSRRDLKMKFKKEERKNPALVDECLTKGLKFDASFFDEESEQEENEEELARLEREDKQKKKEEDKKRRMEERKAVKSSRKRVRKTKSKRGYFDSSEDEDDPDRSSDPLVIDDSIGDDLQDGINFDVYSLPKRPRRKAPVAAPVAAPAVEAPVTAATVATVVQNPKDDSLLREILAKKKEQQESVLPIASFPPGLLAANPSLANATPGSLVVVGSGATPASPNQQLLHVFRVTDDSSRELQLNESNVSQQESQLSQKRTMSETPAKS